MKYLKYISLLVFCCLHYSLAKAQTFTAHASKTKVAVGEIFQISYTLNTNGAGFKAPSLSDFDIYEGPNPYHRQDFDLNTGTLKQTVSYSYILAPKKEGKFTIAPAQINTANGAVKSNSLVIVVTKTTPKSNSNNSLQNSSPATTSDTEDNLFIKAHLSKTKAYLGEELVLSFKIYTRVDVLQLNVTEMPSCDGFYMQEGKVDGQTNETIDGVTYLVADVKKSFIIPLKSGKITIEPIELECVISKPSNKKAKSFIEQFFGAYENIPVKIKSNPVTVEVLPLPEEGKPENFSGAVGSYSMKAQINKESIKANESINLTIDISGEGNIKLVDPLAIDFPEGFETYDPKTNEKIIVGNRGVSGSKSFDYLFIPRYKGDYKIENIAFNYFDPDKKEYITIPSPTFNIHVDKGDDNATNQNVFIPGSKEDVKILGTDIRHIKTGDLNIKDKNDFFFGSILFYSGLAAPLLAFITFLLIRKKQIEESKDIIALKSKKANKVALKRLKAAEEFMKVNDKDAFYIELSKALFGYLSDKLNLPTVDLSQENISQLLKNKQISDNTISRVLDTINNCEYAKYAPGSVSGDLNAIYNQTVELITNIENEIK